MSKEMKMQVTAELAVSVIPNENYEFLMTTKEVAYAYGTSEYAVRKALLRNSSDLIESKHVIRGSELFNEKGGTNCPPLPNAQPHQVFWTKRGIVRLGFFIKSERAKLFRDWAEELIIKIDEQKDLFGQSEIIKTLPEPKRRNHNRLTQSRLLDIMVSVSKVTNDELRSEIIEKLGL